MDGWQARLRASVQLRLVAALSVAILLVTLAGAAFVFASAFEEAHEMQDNTLRQVAVLFDRQRLAPQAPNAAAMVGDDEESRFTVQYLGAGDGTALTADLASPLALPSDLADGISTQRLHGEHFRVLVRTTAQGTRIAVAQETGARDKEARESAWRSLLPLLILFPVLLLVVSNLIGKLFRPIAVLSAQIDARAEQALHPIDEHHVPVEVRPFVVAINRLLGRVAQAMEVQGRFVADAAHELRSPLTALSLQAERLANVDMPPAAQQRLLPLRQGIERGRHLIDQLLTLTRAQALPERPAALVSVHAVFRRVLEDLLPLAEDKGIDIGVDGDSDAWVMMHELDLLTLTRNLADNAIRYSPPGARVDLSVRSVQGSVCLQVCDNGPGIALAERARIFDPFYRGLGSEQIGSGLGLSIVKTIADRAAARIELAFHDSHRQRGLCVSVFIPAHAP